MNNVYLKNLQTIVKGIEEILNQLQKNQYYVESKQTRLLPSQKGVC